MKPIEAPTLETFGVSAEEAVREMRFRIYQETCLTASAGYFVFSLVCNVLAKMFLVLYLLHVQLISDISLESVVAQITIIVITLC